MSGDRLWVNTERTVLVRLWESGTVEVATRDHPSDTWGPPMMLAPENDPYGSFPRRATPSATAQDAA